MQNVFLKIQYDGTRFHGWQRQPKLRTVQGEIERVLSKLCKQPIDLQGTSRTDAGVHAYGQAASFCGEYEIPIKNLRNAANRMLPNDIFILEAKRVADDFHARFSSKGKTYIYKILVTNERDVFCQNYYYNICKKLNMTAMRNAMPFFVGTHDFRAFMSSGSKIQNTVRSIYTFNMEVRKIKKEQQGLEGQEIIVEVTGNGFLYNMVRIMAGTLVDVGLGKKQPEDIINIIKSKKRRLSGHIAPPGGLYLKDIYFNE